ncbi:GNAT family N-acetyltransferase [Paenibacillus antri]|uniref:GNAT family N-acetyltransferase n=1 Tax=Paenibacillus antri TaxID=2582848 RepID=A0A5R9GDQ4_9BACL|nr:GNAT family N-acetyltransferase [Paenibacillus antri]TLS52230.1 GNAT family N-acetyltransferase [Paenibacillus antri]
MNAFEIRTARLTLRPLQEDEAELSLDFAVRNRSFLQPWEPVRNTLYYTLETHRDALIDEAAQRREGRALRLWLFERGRAIGNATLSNIVGGCFQSCHLGYKMDERETGKGYMTEAVEAIVRVAFDTLSLHRIEANVMPRNAASLRVVEKLGFYREGLARKYLKINGVWEDHIHMVLRNEKLE